MATNKITPIGRHHVIMKSPPDEFTGASEPMLFIDVDGVPKHLTSLSQYFNDNTNAKHGYQWRCIRARAVGLFYDFRLEYIRSGEEPLNPLKMLIKFGKSVSLGTISPVSSVDPLGLNWPATSISNSKKLVAAIKGYIDWCALKGIFDENEINTNSKEYAEENYLKYLYRATRIEIKSLFSHLIDNKSLAKKLARTEADSLLSDHSSVIPSNKSIKYFPSWLVPDLLEHGFITRGKNGAKQENTTAKLITLIHLFGGTRISEPFHLWFNDIIPQMDGTTKVILAHPSDSHTNIIGEKNMTRRLYLSMRGLYPRNTDGNSKSYHAGWKKLAVDESLVAPVFFLHSSAENLIRAMFLNYLNYRNSLMKNYIERHGTDHPFLFVSSQGKYAGEPYSTEAYRRALNDAYDRLEKKFGYVIPRGRKYGTNPHGMRHFYGQGLRAAGMGLKDIQKAMRHRSVISQTVYTEATDQDIRKLLDSAKYRIENNQNATITADIIGAIENNGRL